MKVLIVHRAYRLRGGEDSFLETLLAPTLKKMGADAEVEILPPLTKSPLDLIEIFFMLLGLEKLRPSYWRVRRRLNKSAFTHIMLNNFVPTLSLSIPALAQKKGLKVFWWIHNARVYCANGLAFNGKSTCHDCVTVSSFRCGTQNCYQNKWQSWLYALVYRGQRVFKKVAPHIDKFLPVSDYAASHVKLAWKNAGFNGEPSIEVATPFVPRALEDSTPSVSLPISRPFYLFMGRVSFEKGADLFADMCAAHPQKVFVLAGEGPLLESIKSRRLSNLNILGNVAGGKKEWLLKNCSALVITSRVPENAPMVVLESDVYKTPVIYPEGGGAEELVKKLGRKGRPLTSGLNEDFVEIDAPVSIRTFPESLSTLNL